jgi:hypothetical protein
MPFSLSRGSRTGRVHSHQQRPQDNSVSTLGDNLPDVGEDCDNALHDTVQQGMDDKCHKDHRWRQLKIAESWEKSCCPQRCKVGV